MPMKPTVSIIMTAYNHEKFVRKALTSALEQSYENVEVVVVDDGSKDRTWEVIKSIRDARLKPIRQKNAGVSMAANIARQNATGDFLTHASCDDFLEPTRIEEQVAEYQKYGDDHLQFTHVKYVNESDQETPAPKWAKNIFNVETKSQAETLRHLFFKGNYLHACTMLTSRRMFQKMGEYNPILLQLQDYDMWIRGAKQAPVRVLKRPLYNYRILDGQANLGGASLLAKRRDAAERYFVLREFFKGMSSDLFREAFGENYIELDLPRETLDLYNQALVFTSGKSPQHRLCGAEVLSKLFSNPESQKQLLAVGVSPKSVADLFQHSDVFNTGPFSSKNCPHWMNKAIGFAYQFKS